MQWLTVEEALMFALKGLIHYIAYILARVYICGCVCECARNDQTGQAQPQDPEKEWAYPGSILSHTLMLWPRPGPLWFPWSEAAAALIFSSKLQLPSKVNGQKSRRVGSDVHSKEAAVVERQCRHLLINKPLSITTLSTAGWDVAAAFMWNKLKMS